MKKTVVLISLIFLLNGCVETFALLGTSVGGVSSGKITQASLQTSASLGVKKTTGKSPIEHALSFAEEKNSKKKNEPCLSFTKKTNLEFCTIVKKKIISTHAKIENKKFRKKPLKEIAASLQPTIDKKSKIKYLD